MSSLPSSSGTSNPPQDSASTTSDPPTPLELPPITPADQRPLILVEIENDDEARLCLREWNEEIQGLEKDYDREVRICETSRADLNQAMGLFVVFQGVILTAVAQSSDQLTCNKSKLSLIMTLSVLASFCALANTYVKLKAMVFSKERYDGHQRNKMKLSKMIAKLKEKGPGHENYRPESGGGDAEDQTPIGGRCSTNLRRLWVVWIFSYAGAVFLAICTFGGITLLAVYEISCKK